MEFVFATRGHIDDTEKFIRNLRSVWMRYGKSHTVEMNVKPLLLWDIAFPKEELDPILNTLLGDRSEHKKSMKKRYWFLSTAFNQLRKLLKLKPIPTKTKDPRKLPIWTNNVEIMPIGIKEDKENNYQFKNGEKVEGI